MASENSFLGSSAIAEVASVATKSAALAAAQADRIENDRWTGGEMIATRRTTGTRGTGARKRKLKPPKSRERRADWVMQSPIRVSEAMDLRMKASVEERNVSMARWAREAYATKLKAEASPRSRKLVAA